MRIDIALDFSEKPFGRFKSDGKFSGERFRDEFLIPAFNEEQGKIIVYLDGVSRGYGSSFLEEAFAGLLRKQITYAQVKERLVIETVDEDYREEIWDYIEEQWHRQSLKV
ncbi:STAS-like domain-containing protein [Vibrio parahaemolyticus]|uniref:STAS-like domain-containing protein n=1 Tax=Vibrio harveyi group TaxID=717610 RepID=UPI001A2C5093|nr:STAS-like domain-containing protein [Vibrio parahaemolyticus]EGQ7795555.1 STAS-like domain-containing protein [Vibrio parahaemolyticus]EGQ7810150.1 STAS-like domain-containing protein [Vibrio parahaemolyticus]MCZ6298231.1 STAS-like domain-containing protein [Vibrio parahaemolyticus]HCG9219801.1 STAS-like domain-containing protein [Vibrio parahaemolyticus]HCH1198547.1 STAS-like domain-containing protein [Vibrio parahaemolyticus]